ncbi:MAG: hypothetical protein ABI721_05595 [Candidatus Dojkabacteria bacterium]
MNTPLDGFEQMFKRMQDAAKLEFIAETTKYLSSFLPGGSLYKEPTIDSLVELLVGTEYENNPLGFLHNAGEQDSDISNANPSYRHIYNLIEANDNWADFILGIAPEEL